MSDEILKNDIRDLKGTIQEFRSFVASRELFAKEIITILKEVSTLSANMNHRDFEFVTTHNEIVNALSTAEKKHIDTLESFLSLLQKRSDKVLEITPQIEQFNKAIEEMALTTDHISSSLTKINASSINTVQYLSTWEEKAHQKIKDVIKKSVSSFFKRAGWVLILNGLFTLASLVFVYLMYRGG
ncbi:MAG: hypothetical protein KJ737_04370 [Proteobacteria bacterium]|nr:hypothetical protein [Pseudomonadota bacterium]